MDAFERLAQLLLHAGVRFVVIGLAGANYYARTGGTLFLTQDRDLLLPLDAENTLAAWRTCEAMGLAISSAIGSHWTARATGGWPSA
jgi:hypothetical protein